jgi:hypothetical protein
VTGARSSPGLGAGLLEGDLDGVELTGADFFLQTGGAVELAKVDIASSSR